MDNDLVREKTCRKKGKSLRKNPGTFSLGAEQVAEEPVGRAEHPGGESAGFKDREPKVEPLSGAA